MPTELDAISRPGLIVCEGPDDERFLRTMLTHLGVDTIWVDHVQGESQFRRYVRGLRARAGFEMLRTFAIVRDADTDVRTKFNHACSQLGDFGYPVPTLPLHLASGPFPGLESGAVGFTGVTGIMILPPEKKVGALEDLCLGAIGADPSLPCVDAFLTCVERRATITWPEAYRPKARLNAWLSLRPDPRRRLREALSATMFPLEHDVFRPVRQFLHDLAAAASQPQGPSQ